MKDNFDKLVRYIPRFIVDAQTQLMFNDSITNTLTLSFNSGGTDRKTVDTPLEHHVDIGSAQNVNSPKYLRVTHKRADRIGVPNKAKNVAFFDHLIA